MHIANNVLKHSLQNVYFLTGSPLAGKTTMCKKLSEKHGFIWCDYNHNGEPFKMWESICDEKYQPLQTKRNYRVKKQGVFDWDAYYNRAAEDIVADRPKRDNNDEFMEFVMIELIKLSQDKKVITDITAPLELLVEISDYKRIACLLTSAELLTTVNYGSRDDHKDYLDWLMSLNESEKKIAKQDEIFKIDNENIFKEVRENKLFNILRTEHSTIEGTLKLLEEHFSL